MTHYEILEVAPNAGSEVIRAAYKTLVQKYHPDRNPGNEEFASRTQKISSAYSVLSDEVKRAEYDRFLAAYSQSDKSLEGVKTPVDVVERKKIPPTDSLPRPNPSFSTALLVCGGLIFASAAGYFLWETETKKNELFAEKWAKQYEENTRLAEEKDREQRTFRLFPKGHALKIYVVRPTSPIPDQRTWNIAPIELLVGKKDFARVLSSLEKNRENLQRSVLENLSKMTEKDLLEIYAFSQIEYRIKTISNQMTFGYQPDECQLSLDMPVGTDCLGVVRVSLRQRIDLQ